MSKSVITKIRSNLKTNNHALSGYLIFIGGIQWFIGLLAAESWYPGYSSRIDYVSELGLGPTAVLYNASVFLLGAFIVAGAYVFLSAGEGRIFPVLLSITGIGAMGVGIFSGYMQPMHSIFTLIAIMFGSFAAMASYKHQKKPMAYISLILGLMVFIASIVFLPYFGLPTGSTETFLGMAKGSLERWAIYPILAWCMSFGSYLVGSANNNPAQS